MDDAYPLSCRVVKLVMVGLREEHGGPADGQCIWFLTGVGLYEMRVLTTSLRSDQTDPDDLAV